ncbi:MAG TPA: hypothetical protein VM328_00375 [Fimbriimonadaceae bacterium]|jgi:hypothetical protein|nr:hypothetical protein [Fimbriimonadaceae bacterium]
MGSIRGRLHEYSARRAGRKDGRRGIPAGDADTHPFELLAIKQRGDEALWTVAKAWKEADAAPMGREHALDDEVGRAEAALAERRERFAVSERERTEEERRDKEHLRTLEPHASRRSTGT